MTSTSWSRVEPIVMHALDLDDVTRETYLANACRDDATLRGEVDALLGLNGRAATFLERPALEAAARTLGDTLRPDARIGAVLGQYRLDSVIGIGGMGEVYRARDLRLERDVAVKVLAHAGRSSDRSLVEAEARAASRLTHPNIVTIHGVGEADGLGFIAMELVNGNTLRTHFEEGVLPLGQALDLAVQLARALAAAHTAGIVHRDLKPDNVMVTTEGLLKVLDFGIARASHADARQGGGTAAYMSPEQAAGEAPRPVSDQFSLGVLLYELFAGRHPFVRPTRSETLEAIRTVTPLRIDRINRALPPALASIVARCLEKDAGDRFPSVDVIVSALIAVREDLARSVWTRRRILRVAATAAGIGTLGAAGLWKYGPWESPVRTLAVLPFRNSSGDPGENYLSDGIAATLLERLSLMPSLNVLPRSLMFNFRETEEPATVIARRFGANIVLSGTVSRRAGRMQVSARLEEVGGRVLWAGTYDRTDSELLLVQEAIAAAIIDEGIKARLQAEERRRILMPLSADVVAYERYLEAVSLCHEGTESGYLEARELLREALERDPQFGHGHVQMATTYALMAIDGLERPIDAWQQSSRHERRALAVEPDLADAYACAASREFSFNWDWDAAEAEWRRAMRFGGMDLHTDLVRARAQQRWALGYVDEALGLIRQARKRDPVTPLIAIREADLLLYRGDLPAAEGIYRSVLATAGDDPRTLFGLSEVFQRAAQLDAAVSLRRRAHAAAGETALTDQPPLADPARELARLDAGSARLRLQALDERAADSGYVSPLDRARELARLGQIDRSLAHLDDAVAEHAAGLAYLNVDRVWNAMRAIPRFDAFRQRIGLPPFRGTTT